MTSLTSDCDPKPIATPNTPAPAISGPISTPRPERTISTATTAMKTARKLRRIGNRVIRRELRACCTGSAATACACIRRRLMKPFTNCHTRSAASKITMPASAPRKIRLKTSSCIIAIALILNTTASQAAARAMIRRRAPRSIRTLRITLKSSAAEVSSIVFVKALVKRSSGGRPIT
ncbi:hypothetical protein D9M70_531850 [compost metagenome]